MQQENLDKKTALCERAEAIAAEIYDKPKDWSIHSEAILETQKEWRTVGFAPKNTTPKYTNAFVQLATSFSNISDSFTQDIKAIRTVITTKK